MNEVIKFKNVSKKFIITHEDEKTLFNSLQNFLLNNSKKEVFQVLKNISFEIKKGELIGVIGPNGSGKTTLLRMIANIIKPSKGLISTKGRILSIIDLGSDINPDLTGKENIFLSGRIIGLKRIEIKEQYDKIVSFSGIKKFIDVKTKFYSSGMRLRLAFSILLLSDADIILIDEVFGVGDESFRNKCLKKFNEFIRQGKTIIIATHDLGLIGPLSNKIIYLNKNDFYFGIPEIATKKYTAFVHGLNLPNLKINNGSGEVKLNSFKIFDVFGLEKNVFNMGERIRFSFNYTNNKSIDDFVFGLGIFSESGVWIMGPNTKSLNKSLVKLKDKGSVSFDLLDNSLLPGKYSVTISVLNKDRKSVV